MSDDPAQRILEELGQTNQSKIRRRISSVGRGLRSGWRNTIDWAKKRPKRAAIVGASALALAAGVGYLIHEGVTRRWNYPIRHVLYDANHVVFWTGGPNSRSSQDADYDSYVSVSLGGESAAGETGFVETRTGTFEFLTERIRRESTYVFFLRDRDSVYRVSSTQKPEIAQPIFSVSGSFNYRQEDAVFYEDRSEQYITDKFIPYRALEDREITSLIRNGQRHLVTRLTDRRQWGMGYLFGREYRGGTFVEHYRPETTSVGRSAEVEAIRLMRRLTTEDLNQDERREIFWQIYEEQEKIPVLPVLTTFEDGIFDWLPQESTCFLGVHPGRMERILRAYCLGGDDIRYRVQNNWDLFPGNWIPPINRFHIGSDRDIWFPFNKYNNGGYDITDEFGTVARIDFQDFWWHYGSDVVYNYFADLNGDGQIAHGVRDNPELIGRVLVKPDQDVPIDLEEVIGTGHGPQDVTQSMNFVYMGTTGHLETDMRYFDLCNYVETMMPDQIHRGYSRHSYLGWVNEVRADIQLFNHPNWDNMSRSLTEESVLPAPHDIVRLLIATGRPYAEQVAERYGIADQYQGQFNPSPNLHERWDLGMWPGTLLTLGSLAGICAGAVWYRQKRRQNPLLVENRAIRDRIDGN